MCGVTGGQVARCGLCPGGLSPAPPPVLPATAQPPRPPWAVGRVSAPPSAVWASSSPRSCPPSDLPRGTQHGQPGVTPATLLGVWEAASVAFPGGPAKPTSAKRPSAVGPSAPSTKLSAAPAPPRGHGADLPSVRKAHWSTANRERPLPRPPRSHAAAAQSSRSLGQRGVCPGLDPPATRHLVALTAAGKAARDPA